jgi:hypothetical protein
MAYANDGCGCPTYTDRIMSSLFDLIVQFLGPTFWILAVSTGIIILSRSLLRERQQLAAMAMASGGCAAGLISFTNRYFGMKEPFFMAIGVAMAIGCIFALAEAFRK